MGGYQIAGVQLFPPKAGQQAAAARSLHELSFLEPGHMLRKVLSRWM